MALPCVAGLWLRLWCGDLGQWLWVRADHPRRAEWKHPGGLRGVLPPAWQGKYWLHSRTHSHARNLLCFLKATWHYRLLCASRRWTSNSCIGHDPPYPRLPCGSGCVALMGWLILGWWMQPLFNLFLDCRILRKHSVHLWTSYYQPKQAPQGKRQCRCSGQM